MKVDDALDRGKADPSAGEVAGAMQPLKGTK
jgi:hypothetical protein